MVILEPITRQKAMIFKDVRLRALQDTPSAFGSTYAREAQMTDADWMESADQWTGERSAAYLAMDTEIACGIAAGYLDKDDAARTYLVSMWVAPTHRRLGIGRSLVDAILAWARAQSVRTVYLMVTSNNVPAMRFYERLGFVQTGRTEPYPNDPALIEYEMSRPLSPRAAEIT